MARLNNLINSWEYCSVLWLLALLQCGLIYLEPDYERTEVGRVVKANMVRVIS